MDRGGILVCTAQQECHLKYNVTNITLCYPPQWHTAKGVTAREAVMVIYHPMQIVELIQLS